MTGAPLGGAPVPLDETEALRYSVRGLLDRDPIMSAAKTFTRGQLVVLFGTLGTVLLALVLWPQTSATALVAVLIALYLGALIERVLLFSSGLRESPQLVVSDEEALALDPAGLPMYTILVPAFNEPQIVGQLVRNLGALDYPAEKLDIQLLLEENDTLTITNARAALAEGVMPTRIVLVPQADPQTKPKACNFGLQYATGEFTTIYDAEDRPDPLQLRRVIVCFRRLGEKYACVQGKLTYHNDRQNMLTKWFTVEYDQWFGFILPGLMTTSAPIPLGGTSNHIRTDVLQAAGAWDPFNVTEDADLGVRLARMGYRTAVVDSFTLEEANSDPINWVRQRSRWYKGYLQTFLVHSRRPRQLAKDIGWAATARFVVITAGTPLSAVINVAFWGLALAWELGEPAPIRNLFPSLILYPAAISLAVGNSAVIYLGLAAVRGARKPHLLIAALLVPAYWILMSIAAMKAMFQLVFQPSYWEKTVHGLDQRHDDAD